MTHPHLEDFDPSNSLSSSNKSTKQTGDGHEFAVGESSNPLTLNWHQNLSVGTSNSSSQCGNISTNNQRSAGGLWSGQTTRSGENTPGTQSWMAPPPPPIATTVMTSSSLGGSSHCSTPHSHYSTTPHSHQFVLLQQQQHQPLTNNMLPRSPHNFVHTQSLSHHHHQHQHQHLAVPTTIHSVSPQNGQLQAPSLVVFQQPQQQQQQHQQFVPSSPSLINVPTAEQVAFQQALLQQQQAQQQAFQNAALVQQLQQQLQQQQQSLQHLVNQQQHSPPHLQLPVPTPVPGLGLPSPPQQTMLAVAPPVDSAHQLSLLNRLAYLPYPTLAPHAENATPPAPTLRSIFIGHIPFERPAVLILEIFRQLTGVSLSAMERAGSGCFTADAHTPQDIETVCSLHNKILFDRSGFWFAQTSQQVACLREYVENPTFRNRAVRLPKGPVVIEKNSRAPPHPGLALQADASPRTANQQGAVVAPSLPLFHTA